MFASRATNQNVTIFIICDVNIIILVECMLCKYRDILGKPKTGIHSLRLFNIAVVDVVGMVILACATSILLNQPMWLTTLTWLLLAILLHLIFGVNTTINKMIFGECAQ
jgi:hypothetical protein